MVGLGPMKTEEAEALSRQSSRELGAGLLEVLNDSSNSSLEAAEKNSSSSSNIAAINNDKLNISNDNKDNKDSKESKGDGDSKEQNNKKSEEIAKASLNQGTSEKETTPTSVTRKDSSQAVVGTAEEKQKETGSASAESAGNQNLAADQMRTSNNKLNSSNDHSVPKSSDDSGMKNEMKDYAGIDKSLVNKDSTKGAVEQATMKEIKVEGDGQKVNENPSSSAQSATAAIQQALPSKEGTANEAGSKAPASDESPALAETSLKGSPTTVAIKGEVKTELASSVAATTTATAAAAAGNALTAGSNIADSTAAVASVNQSNDGPVVWVIYTPSKPDLELRRIKEGEEQILGRDYPDMPLPALEVTDMKVSRKQIKAVATRSGLQCTCQGQNAMTYIADAKEPNSRKKIKTKETFMFRPKGMVEMHFKSRGGSQLRIRPLITHPTAGARPLSPGHATKTPLEHPNSQIEELSLSAPLERTSSAQWAIDGTTLRQQRSNQETLSPNSRMLMNGSPRIWNGSSPRARRLSAHGGTAADGSSSGLEGASASSGDVKEGGMEFSWSSAARDHSASPRREDNSSIAGEIMGDLRSASPTFDPTPSTETVRTADEFPFSSSSSRKGNSGASIFASDKHHPHAMSPRVAKRKRSVESAAEAVAASIALGASADAEADSAEDGLDGKRQRRSSRTRKGDEDSLAEIGEAQSRSEEISTGNASRKNSMEATSEGAEGAAGDKTEILSKEVDPPVPGASTSSVIASTAAKDSETIIPQGPGARVGQDFQVEVPAMLRKVKDLRLVGKGKGSIGAWNKLMHNEPEPLPFDADQREDTTLEWTPAEKRAFNKGMYESLKDFISIYRNDSIFKRHGKTPHDLVAYYYRQYKDTMDYPRWKAHVAEGTSTGPPPEYGPIDDDMNAHGGDMSPHAIDLMDSAPGGSNTSSAMSVSTGSTTSAQGGNSSKSPNHIPGILLDMIKWGYLESGEDVFQVEYQGKVTKGSLNEDGVIECEGNSFDSVSRFSVYCKRKSNPKLSGDNGWLSIMYDGKTLGSIRDKYTEKKKAQEASDQAGGGSASSVASSGTGKPITSSGSTAGRASRRSSVASTAATGELQRTSSTCSSSLPANFGASTRSSVANLGVAGQGPATTTSPWTASDNGTRRGAGRVSTRQQATRQQGFFDLQIESESDLSDDEAMRRDLPPVTGGRNSAVNAPPVRAKKDETMKNLIDAEILRPGKRVLRVRYKSHEFWADLRTDGIIVDSATETEFASPSLWSIEIKRRVNPNVRSDSGWYSIFYIPPGTGSGGAESASRSGDDDQESGEGRNMEEDDDDDDMRSGIDDDIDESRFENLHTYRKKYRSVRDMRRQKKMKESFNLINEVKALRSRKAAPTVIAAREDELETHRYTEATLLQWRPQTPPPVEETPEIPEVTDDDDAQSVSSRAGPGRKKRKRRKVAGRAAPAPTATTTQKVNKEPKLYCVCQRRSGEDDDGVSESEADESEMDDEHSWYLQCSKASGACNGWIHPKCFDIDITQRDGEKMKEFICPLCSGDGIELRLVKSERNIKDHVAVYSVGTLIMSKVEYPKGNPVGWFPAKIIEVDFTHHIDTPYLVSYAFNPLLTEWITLGPNDPTRMLAVDWAKSPCYKEQDEKWRKAAEQRAKEWGY